MNQRTENELQEFVTELKNQNKSNHPKSIPTYMFELKRQFLEIDDESILESIRVYNEDKEMYQSKPIPYFVRIVQNKFKDKQTGKSKEKENSDIPLINI